MNRLSLKLAAVLGLQLVLALVLWAGGPDYNAFKAKEPVLAFDPAKVDGIEIAEGSANSVVLVKEDGKWVIPSSAGFPADAAKVSGLLTKLAGLKKGWPVATSAEAAKRFKVSDDAFERRVVLKSGGGTLGELLLGTSPNFKSVSVRAGGDGNVYSVAFSTYEVGARGDEWQDRGLLNIQQDQIASIAIGDVLLERKDGKYVLPGLAAGQKQDETATYRLTGALTYPVFEAVVGKGAEAQAKVSAPDIEITVKRTSGEPIVLKYKKEAAGGAYLFTSSANGFLFRASEAAMEPIAKAKREALIEAPKKAGAEPANGAGAKVAGAEGDKDAAAQTGRAEEPGKAGEDGAMAAPEPVKPEAPKKAKAEAVAVPAKQEEPKAVQEQRAQAVAEPVKPEEPKKAEEDAARTAAKPEEPKKAEDEGAMAAPEPVKPEEPKKAEGEGAQAVPAAEAKKDEDERFQAAMQPPKLDESKKAEGEGATAVPAAEPKKAEDEPPAAPQAAKPAEARNAGADGAAPKAEPEKPAASQ